MLTARATSMNKPVDSGERLNVPVGLFALSSAIIVTNLFAPQTLIGPMAVSLGIPTASSGLIAMDTLLGYAAGLFFLVPLADLVENRGLILRMLAVAALGAAGAVIAPNTPLLFILLFVLGAGCSAIQVLIPVAAAMAEPERRGQVIGDVVSGLMTGILLSRPIASFLTGTWGWKAYYVASAVSITLLAITLAFRLPKRVPEVTTSYRGLIASLWHLFSTETILRERSISAAIVMAAFNFFWTTIAFVLGGAPFHYGQIAIAIFALVGAGGAIVTPMIGRWSDQGHGKLVTAIAHIMLIAGFAVAALSVLTPSIPVYLMVAGLGLSAIMLDVGVLGEQTVGRYLVNQLRPEARGRINGIFVGVFFLGGALGSALSAMLWSMGGWGAICLGGGLLGLLVFAMRKR